MRFNLEALADRFQINKIVNLMSEIGGAVNTRSAVYTRDSTVYSAGLLGIRS